MSKRYTGGIVSATKPTTSGGELGSASGLWEIEQQGRLQAAGLWPIPYIPKYVEDVFSTYLYTGNGNNNGNDVPNGIVFGGVPTNGTILHFTGDALSDSAPVPCPFSNVGASVNTTTKKYGTGSLFFNGTSTNIITANSAGLRFGTGDFTVECWVYNTSSGNQGIFHLGDNFGSGCVFVNMYPAGFFQWGWDGSYTGSVGSFPSNTWIHVALVRQSGVMKLYVNGTQVGSNNTFGGSINLGRIWVGNYYDTNYAWNGYIDDFRVSNKAVYTANFTPPAQALPLDTIVSGTNYGGMTWMKCRSTAYSNALFDTLRGGANTIRSNTTDGNTSAGSIAFNTSGWCVNTSNAQFNAINDTYVSWSFRRQARFFDIVTWTGDGTSARAIPHSLGSAPGCILVKGTSTVTNWKVYHRSLGASNELILNLTNASSSSSSWGSTTPTSSVFYVGDSNNVASVTYVAYLFAHDAAGFGAAGADNVISCGSYTGNGSGSQSVTLGWEPQWILVKSITAGATYNEWWLFDSMRNWPIDSSAQKAFLKPNASAAESTTSGMVATSATGFNIVGSDLGQSGITFIYIAIRRGPMRTPTNGTSVYYGLSRSGTSANATVSGSPFPVDLALIKNRSNNDAFPSNPFVFDRVRGSLNGLISNTTDAASTAYTGSLTGFDVQNGYKVGNESSGWVNWAGSSGGATYMNWMFRRAPGFLDIVTYTGTGANTAITHGLGAAPELIITKCRNTTSDWAVYAAPLGAGNWLRFNTNAGSASSTTVWGNTAPTASQFTVGTSTVNNTNGNTYIAYLFSSIPGVSKIGTYTGSASNVQVDCGFTGGARFVLIKRTDNATYGWYVMDTVRGIVVGADGVMILNSTNRESTSDYLVPYAPGFEVTTTSPSVNSASGTYIYLAIA